MALVVPRQLLFILAICGMGFGLTQAGAAPPVSFTLTTQVETSTGSNRYHRLQNVVDWAPEKTAVIVCDMWDLHHCHRAVLRVQQLAPRMEQVLQKARALGMTLIHAPSSCMPTYASHPARLRAMAVPLHSPLPSDIKQWCYKIPQEEKGVYPIDQSNGGEDDDPDEHAAWAAELVKMGRDPKAPWKSQYEKLSIDGTRDYISDQGDEIWSILESRGIQNVILMGVHTNMCVLGRPFGLRRMVQAGKTTALMSDMTDTMYDPHSSPYVSHFTGTDLMIDHIERHVCPTITSDQLVGGRPLRFAEDKRSTIAILMAEDEYKTELSLPAWSQAHLGKDFRVRLIFGSDTDKYDVPGIEAIAEADLLMVSARRRPLPENQMEIVRKFVSTGKPMLGIRTASHAFSLRGKEPPAGTVSWPEWDAQVWGGNYTNHHGNQFFPKVTSAKHAKMHAILEGWGNEAFISQGSLYKVSPLAKGTEVLLMGTIDQEPTEPVAWTFSRERGGKSFYTSLGHASDFADRRFQRLLSNAVAWLLQP